MPFSISASRMNSGHFGFFGERMSPARRTQTTIAMSWVLFSCISILPLLFLGGLLRARNLLHDGDAAADDAEPHVGLLVHAQVHVVVLDPVDDPADAAVRDHVVVLLDGGDH